MHNLCLIWLLYPLGEIHSQEMSVLHPVLTDTIGGPVNGGEWSLKEIQ